LIKAIIFEVKMINLVQFLLLTQTISIDSLPICEKDQSRQPIRVKPVMSEKSLPEESKSDKPGQKISSAYFLHELTIFENP
jgi:hypothetical protein